MLVRLRDFAELHRISERTVQVHIKNNQEELEGHIERRGKQGTWLDEFAVNFLLDRIQLPTKDEVLMPTPREAALLMEIAETNRRLADAERRAGENAEAAGKVKLLEAAKEDQEAQILALAEENGRIKAEAAQERGLLEGFIADAKEQIDVLGTEKAAWVKYAKDLEAWNALGWWKKRNTPKPVRPELPEEVAHEG